MYTACAWPEEIHQGKRSTVGSVAVGVLMHEES